MNIFCEIIMYCFILSNSCMDYGAIGFYIAHEFTHSLDINGNCFGSLKHLLISNTKNLLI